LSTPGKKLRLFLSLKYAKNSVENISRREKIMLPNSIVIPHFAILISGVLVLGFLGLGYLLRKIVKNQETIIAHQEMQAKGIQMG